MRSSVHSVFKYFSAEFEGRVTCMYLDTHEPPLVTIGIGNMIEPIEEALALPFLRRSTGMPATGPEIRDEWNTVKSLVELSKSATSVWIARAQLYLSPAAIDDLVMGKLGQFEAALKLRPAFADYELWPADAQLGALSMAWAMGVHNFDKFPRFEQALTRLDFTTAAAECRMDDTHNEGLKPRNRANVQLFLNAAKVEQTDADPATLFYSRTA